jgi:hypothetical protein
MPPTQSASSEAPAPLDAAYSINSERWFPVGAPPSVAT